MSSGEIELPNELLEALKQKKYADCVEGLNRLSQSGSTSADMALAHIHFTGGDGIPRNFERARPLLERIYQLDPKNSYAAHRLGAIHYKGLGVRSDHKVAYAFFRRAAPLGNAGSLLMVGAMQKEGDGTLTKSRTAKKIFLACARDKRQQYTTRLMAMLWLIPLVRGWRLGQARAVRSQH